MKRTFNDWHAAVEEAERLINTPYLIEIAVTLHTAVNEPVTMDYRIKRAVLGKAETAKKTDGGTADD